MQLDNLLLRKAGFLVQTIDILGNHTIQPVQVIEFSDGVMTAIRLGLNHGKPELFIEIPVLLSTCLACHKTLKIKLVRVEPIPNSSRATKIRNA